MNKCVFLDRDGVINESIIKNGKPYPPATLEQLKITNGALEALQKLKDQGYLLIVVTNQPDVVRGAAQKKDIEAMNRFLQEALPLQAFYVCYHDDQDHCECRKPKPGLLKQAAKDLDIDLSQSFMIGDRWRDIEAGQQAGCKTIWIDQHYQEKKPDHVDFRAASLPEAVTWILMQSEPQAM